MDQPLNFTQKKAFSKILCVAFHAKRHAHQLNTLIVSGLGLLCQIFEVQKPMRQVVDNNKLNPSLELCGQLKPNKMK